MICNNRVDFPLFSTSHPLFSCEAGACFICAAARATRNAGIQLKGTSRGRSITGHLFYVGRFVNLAGFFRMIGASSVNSRACVDFSLLRCLVTERLTYCSELLLLRDVSGVSVEKLNV